MPATETGKMLGRTAFRTQPKSLKNPQQPLDPGCESLREYIETHNLCFIALEAIKVTFKVQACVWGLLRLNDLPQEIKVVVLHPEGLPDCDHCLFRETGWLHG